MHQSECDIRDALGLSVTLRMLWVVCFGITAFSYSYIMRAVYEYNLTIMYGICLITERGTNDR